MLSTVDRLVGIDRKERGGRKCGKFDGEEKWGERNLLCDKVAGINIQLAIFFHINFLRQYFKQFALVENFLNNCKNWKTIDFHPSRLLTAFFIILTVDSLANEGWQPHTLSIKIYLLARLLTMLFSLVRHKNVIMSYARWGRRDERRGKKYTQETNWVWNCYT